MWGYTAHRPREIPHPPYRIDLMSSQPNNPNPTKQEPLRGRFSWAAFVLGLVFPGLGHMLIGERGRAYRIIAGFLVLWIGGLLIGGLGSVRSWEPEYATAGSGPKRNLWFFAQAGAGPIAFVFDQIDRAVIRNAPDEQKIPVSLPKNRVMLVYKDTAIGHAAEFGMLYCALAGLMNVAVALDAGRRGKGERREQQPSGAVRIRRANVQDTNSTQEAQPG